MAFQIPKRHRTSLQTFLALSDKSADELLAALERLPPLRDPTTAAQHLIDNVRSIPSEAVKSITELVYQLYHVREFADVSHAQFLSDLFDSIPDDESVKSDSSRKRLERVLAIDTLSQLAKATRLQRDAERVYCEGRIISDIRPVFADNVDNPPVGAVITHSLRISYHEARDHNEFVVLLDTEDLEKLKALVERALAKAKTLRSLMAKSDLPDLGD
jgi:hypothetical protein